MPSARRIVFLVGFMGAGKSTSGRALARLMEWEFIDLDDRIVETERRGIAEILRVSGEPYFRRLETRLLAEIRGRDRVVVACGGGTYAHEPSRALIDEAGIAVWLQVPLDLALARCVKGPERPLLQGAAQAEALYRARLPAYRAAPLSVAIEGLSPAEVAERIAALLRA